MLEEEMCKYTVLHFCLTVKCQNDVEEWRNPSQALVPHNFNPSTQKAEEADLCENKVSLVY